jgi:hypothetical protein
VAAAWPQCFSSCSSLALAWIGIEIHYKYNIKFTGFLALFLPPGGQGRWAGASVSVGRLDPLHSV